MPLPNDITDTKGMHIIFATSKGKIRKNSLDDFSLINASLYTLEKLITP